MFWLRNEKNNFQLHTLIKGPVYERMLLFQRCEPATASFPAEHISVVNDILGINSVHFRMFHSVDGTVLGKTKVGDY